LELPLGEHVVEDLDARLHEPMAAMLVSQLQHCHSRARVDVDAKDILADQLEPLHAVPIRRPEQTLSDGDLVPAVVTLLQLRECVGVDEVEQSPEHHRLHVVDAHTRAGGGSVLNPRAEELGHEDWGAGGENAPVRG